MSYRWIMEYLPSEYSGAGVWANCTMCNSVSEKALPLHSDRPALAGGGV
jgi:hypothetical protein